MRGGSVGLRAGRLHALVPLALAAALASSPGCDAAPTGPAGPVVGRALAGLDVGAVALLPAAVLGAEPPPRLTAGAIPAFDAPHLAGLASDRSYSIGTASRGYLVGARQMAPDTDWLKGRPSARRKDALWGTDELVGALERAGRHVAERWPGSVLWAGDLSARHGGDLSGHASHNSGRDVDLCFYMRDDAGRIADTHRMLPIAPGGRVRWGGDFTFDAARNWALVEALLRDQRVQVQYLFVADHVRALLLAEAERVGADATVLTRARAVMRQPRDSSIHEEHFHLRLYCALAERVEGCVDYGVVHAWVDTYEEALSKRVAEVLPFLDSGGVSEIRYAVTRIIRLRVRGAVPHLEPLREHADPAVARLADDAVAFLEGRRTPPAWSHLTPEDAGD